MGLDKRVGLNYQISEEAAEWLVEFRTGDIDAAGRRDFDAWIRTSPEHLRAFIEMAALWSKSAAIDAQRRLQVDAIIARAEGEGNVVGLNLAAPPRGSAGSGLLAADHAPQEPRTSVAQRGVRVNRRAVRVARLAVAASLLLAVIGAALLLRSSLFGPPAYATGVGERRSIRLPDGSRVVLDSRSQLRVHFTSTTRQVELLQGQALFFVEENPERPFLVRSGGAVIRDVGTQFDVNQGLDGTVVTVVEGRVAVYSTPVPEELPSNGEGASPSIQTSGGYAKARTAGTPARQMPARLSSIRTHGSDRDHEGNGEAPVSNRGTPVLLSAGEQLTVIDGQGSPQPVRANVSFATAWTQGRLVLESATLADAAEEFNRYSSRRLVAEDRGRPLLRLSGVFATNPDFLIRYLRNRPDISVRETDSEIDIVRDRAR